MSTGERVLWSTRLLLLGGVAGSVLLAAAVIWMGTVDLVRFVGDVANDTASDDRSELRSELIAGVVKIVDTYLLAAILVVAAQQAGPLHVARGVLPVMAGRSDRHEAWLDPPEQGRWALRQVIDAAQRAG